jgi:Amt family ammonium transporter
VFGVPFFDKIGIDDPVGAVSVHCLNGAFGTIAVGIFGRSEYGLARDGLLYGGGFVQLGVQLLGVLIVGFFVVILALILFKTMKAKCILRVSVHEERIGLDIEEHGLESYPEFAIFLNR